MRLLGSSLDVFNIFFFCEYLKYFTLFLISLNCLFFCLENKKIFTFYDMLVFTNLICSNNRKSSFENGFFFFKLLTVQKVMNVNSFTLQCLNLMVFLFL